MNLFLHRITSPLGTILLVTDAEDRVRALDFDDYETRMRSLLSTHYGHYDLTPATIPSRAEPALQRYFAGELHALQDIDVATNGSAFQQRVWAALRQIPPARMTTYGKLALQLGQYNGARAVGSANGSNPIAIIVPCHRVVGANGKLTGFAGGLERKAWLLGHERAEAGDQQTLRLPGF
ncbi:methylated-DNA--protein-cysteine methyltransferase [Collimonas arenae]|uniref:methylated-DNA--[protein]-cysteine S-methyltransferase n=1 Tax=Collimonas arenae TaxID=279058 RepID=A0A127QE98_9BURK|nr:methylated-DNA--[protein]-cysteine S-methyltransferase [Collimonas arenae]AMO98067.1 methylated-DNA--protein-cysteine methyltransferase [Collimonas arenae]AMP07932.1 methylated-DNA--protein-cysteine methyltransferase [Collimonas arenae]